MSVCYEIGGSKWNDMSWGDKLAKHVYNYSECETCSHLEICHFMLLFTLVNTPKGCEQKCEQLFIHVPRVWKIVLMPI